MIDRLRGSLIVVAFAVACSWCGGGSSTAPKEAVRTSSTPVRNDTLLLPATGQVGVKVIQDHMLSELALPGGTVGDYEADGRKYQLFVVRADSNQDAALMLLDVKNKMQSPEYVPHMGGYSGMHSGRPLFVFAKLQFLAGVVGLPASDADPVARKLAAKLQ